jgi:putative endonuclease
VNFYVYGIRDSTGKRIYVGECENFEDRLSRHNMGFVKSTKSGRPWTLVAVQLVDSHSKARWIENQLKRSRGKRIKWLRDYAVPAKRLE